MLTEKATEDLQYLMEVLSARDIFKNTRKTYAVWARQLVWFLQTRNKLLHHLNVPLLRKFMAQYLENHSRSCRIQIRAALRIFVQALIEDGMVPKDLKEWFEAKEGKSSAPRPEVPVYLDDDEIGRLLEYLAAHKGDGFTAMRAYVFFTLLFRLGVRVSPLLALHEDQLIRDRQGRLVELRIRQKRDQLTIHPMRNGVGEINEEGAIIEEWLAYRQHLRDHPEVRSLAQRSRAWSQSRYVFPAQYTPRLDGESNDRNMRSRPMNYRVVQQALPRIAREAGIKKYVHPHMLRHSFAMYLRRRGVPLDTLQHLLGHQQIQTTTRYARPQEAEMNMARELLPKGIHG
jgi:site-specific recombinase XerD